MRVGVVGATGQVGTVMRRLLAERKFPIDDIRFFASARSAGTTLEWEGVDVRIEDAALANPRGWTSRCSRPAAARPRSSRRSSPTRA